MLSPLMYDFGQTRLDARFRAHTGLGAASGGAGNKPHRRRVSSRLFRHSSHFHPAGFENWK